MFSVTRLKAFIFLFFLSACLFAQQNSASPLIAASDRFQIINNFQAGMYYIQIGSYANVHTVYSEIEKIDRNLPVAVMPATVIIDGVKKNVHRIFIGPLNYADSVSLLQMFKIKYNDVFVWYGGEEKRTQERPFIPPIRSAKPMSPKPVSPPPMSPKPVSPPPLYRTPSGLQYRVIRQGKGRVPCPTDTIRARFKMTQSGRDVIINPDEEIYVLRVEHIIAGLSEGLQLMNKGSIYRFVIPPHLNAPGDNSTDVYTVELISILTSEQIDTSPGTVDDLISDVKNMSDEEFFNFLLRMHY